MGNKLSKAAQEMGRKGGQRRAKTLSPEQRSEIARKGAEIRWAKTGERKRKQEGR